MVMVKKNNRRRRRRRRCCRGRYLQCVTVVRFYVHCRTRGVLRVTLSRLDRVTLERRNNTRI